MVEFRRKKVLVNQMMKNRNMMRNNQEWVIFPSISSGRDEKKMGRKSMEWELLALLFPASHCFNCTEQNISPEIETVPSRENSRYERDFRKVRICISSLNQARCF